MAGQGKRGSEDVPPNPCQVSRGAHRRGVPGFPLSRPPHALTVHLVLMARVGQNLVHSMQVIQRCILTGYTIPSTSPNTPMEHISRQTR